MATSVLPELQQAFETLSLSNEIPHFAEAKVSNKPLDLCRSYLAELLCSLVECDPEVAYNSIQWPSNISNGDLAVIIPKLCPGSKAQEVAADLVKKFREKKHPLFQLPFLEGVHFRIFVQPSALPRLLLPYISTRKEIYGNDSTLGLKDTSLDDGGDGGGRKKLVVDFSSPNIASEFQGKHLRSTILGAFIGRLYESMGWDVTRINYLGDWGKPIALLKVGWDKFGSEEAYQADPVGHLLDINHQINELFLPEQAESRRLRDEAVRNGQDAGEAQVEIENKGIFAERNAVCSKLEDGDEETVAFWTRVRNVNIDNYTEFYARLGIKFDEYSGESQVNPATMSEVEHLLKGKGISEESGGAWIVHMQKHGAKTGTAIIRDRSGSSTYLLRDLATVLERSRKFEFDKMIYVAANDNSVHFSQLIKILEALDMADLAGKLQHFRLSEVSKLPEKLGKGYKPQTILDRCEEEMLGVLKADEKQAEVFGSLDDAPRTVGISALLVQELSTRTTTAHSFDISTMTAFKSGTGPDLQYWYARLCAKLDKNTDLPQLSDDDYEALAEEENADLLRILAQYPEVTHATFHSLEPTAIAAYLISVVGQLKECFGDEEVDAEADAEAEAEGEAEAEKVATPAQRALYEATRIVLENGMKLLGLTPVGKVEQARVDTPVDG